MTMIVIQIKALLFISMALVLFAGCARTTAFAFHSFVPTRRGFFAVDKQQFYFHRNDSGAIIPSSSCTALKLSSSSSSNFNNSSSNDEKNENKQLSQKGEERKSFEKIELTNEKIAEMLEVTFIKACLQLATGYVDILKLFIAAVTAGYNREIPIPQLIQLVAQCPNNTANRELSKEEIDLRSSWMIVSYLTLETIDRLEGNDKNMGVNKTDLQIPIKAREEFGSVIEEHVQRELGLQGGSSSNDEAVGKVKKSSTDNHKDPQAAAIYAYCIKVISSTISNVKETRLANEKAPSIDEDGVGPPRPKIPGTH